MPSPGDWKRLDALLDAALDVPEAEREAWLDTQCPGEPELRARLRLLLGGATASPLVAAGGMAGPVWSEVAEDLAQGPDAPAPGSRLGGYEIVAELGAGGMGRVYRARDTSLGREVAIKVLASSLVEDPARLRRFEREARLLAGLNHPNIAVLHEVLDLDGARYLVLELVDGETLGQALARGPLPLPEAVAVAAEIAEALEEAHRSGIVHRDLKPSNVMRSRAGRIKVLDFGLAKSVEPEGEGDLTRTAGAATTETGMILGTAPYMSPEQARGEDVDERADVWAFGCLLYEMLTGRRAFDGRSTSDVLAAVLRDAPDFSRLPAGTPPALRRLIERCLRKDQRLRLQAIGDARLELGELGADGPSGPSPRGARIPWRAAAALVGLAACAGFGLAWWWPRASVRPVSARLLVEPGPGVGLAHDYAAPFALAPDGATIVFLGVDEAGQRRLYARPLDRLESRPLPGTEGAWQPFFSPDGRWVGFFADRFLKKVALAGGGPLALAEVGGNPRGAAWAADGTIVVATSTYSGLSRLREQGGPLEPLTQLDAAVDERSHRWPQVLPDGGVLFTVQTGGDDFDEASLQLVSLADGTRRRILKEAAFGRVAGPHLLYARGARLYATRFDRAAPSELEPGQVVLDGIAYDARNGGTQIDVSRTGTLVYVPGRPHPLFWHLVWVDRAGRRERLRGDPRPFHDRRVSPDGRQIAIRVGSSAAADLWLLEVASGTLTQLTFGLAPVRPVWRPDGRGITVASRGGGSYRLTSVAVDRSEPPRTLYEGPHPVYPNDWSPDGRRLVFQERHPATGWGLHVLDVDGTGVPQGAPAPIVDTEHDETMARLSPDGRFLAYESNELDKVFDVYVRPFGRAGPVTRVSTEAGRFPVWGPAGEIFYWRSFRDRIRVARYRADGERFEVLGDDYAFPEASRAERGMRSPHFGFDVEASSGRFLMQEPPNEDPAPPPRMIVALGWLQGLPDPVSTPR